MLRPHLDDFFKRVGHLYEVVIFTASLKKYANIIIDVIDKYKIVKYRLFREQCSLIHQTYVKELKKLNRNMKSVIIMDNNPNMYCLDKENGLPIKSFFNDRNDKELLQMAYILEKLAKVNDVRIYIKEIVEMNQVNYDKAFQIFKQKDTTTINNNNNNNNVNVSPVKGALGMKGQLKVVKVEKLAQNVITINLDNEQGNNNTNVINKNNNTINKKLTLCQINNNNNNINNEMLNIPNKTMTNWLTCKNNTNKTNSNTGKSFRSSGQRSISREDHNNSNNITSNKTNNNNNSNNTPKKKSSFKNSKIQKEEKVKLLPSHFNINTNTAELEYEKKKAKSSGLCDEINTSSNNNNNHLKRFMSKNKNSNNKLYLSKAEITKRPKSVIPLKINDIKPTTKMPTYNNTSSSIQNTNTNINNNNKPLQTINPKYQNKFTKSTNKKTSLMKPSTPITGNVNKHNNNNNNKFKKPETFISARQLTGTNDNNKQTTNTNTNINQNACGMLIGNGKITKGIPVNLNNNTFIRHSSIKSNQKHNNNINSSSFNNNNIPLPAKSDRQNKESKNVSSPPLNNNINSNQGKNAVMISNKVKHWSKSNLKTIGNQFAQINKMDLKMVKIMPNTTSNANNNNNSNTISGNSQIVKNVISKTVSDFFSHNRYNNNK